MFVSIDEKFFSFYNYTNINNIDENKTKFELENIEDLITGKEALLKHYQDKSSDYRNKLSNAVNEDQKIEYKAILKKYNDRENIIRDELYKLNSKRTDFLNIIDVLNSKKNIEYLKEYFNKMKRICLEHNLIFDIDLVVSEYDTLYLYGVVINFENKKYKLISYAVIDNGVHLMFRDIENKNKVNIIIEKVRSLIFRFIKELGSEHSVDEIEDKINLI